MSNNSNASPDLESLVSSNVNGNGNKPHPDPVFHRAVTTDKKATTSEGVAADAKMEGMLYDLLAGLGENPNREGLLDTPARVRRSLASLTDGYGKTPQEVLGSAIFTEHYDEMVLVRDIEMYSMCEHHMLPFFGKCHIAYIPNGKIVGLSKLPRIVDVFSHRLQVQERLTTQIAHALDDLLHPQGVAVVTEAYHLCMMMRGVQKQNSSTVASCMLGGFREDSRTRQEFLNLIQSKKAV